MQSDELVDQGKFKCDICGQVRIIEEEYMKCLKCGTDQCTMNCCKFERVGMMLNTHCGKCGAWIADGSMGGYESDADREKLK